jgi:hypothetical protein
MLGAPQPPQEQNAAPSAADPEERKADLKVARKARLRKLPKAAAKALLLRQKSSSAADPEALLREDAAHAAAEAAKPLPKGSEWHFCGGEELEEPLACTTLIDAAWLLMFALGEVMPERAGVVPAWQDVPPEAVVRLEDLRHTTMKLYLPIAVLSYGWAARHQ